jgi:hypothetical protein
VIGSKETHINQFVAFTPRYPVLSSEEKHIVVADNMHILHEASEKESDVYFLVGQVLQLDLGNNL